MPAQASAESVHQELEKLLSSRGFARNERMARFLRFVLQQQLGGKAAQLKETLIGAEVFGRKPDYDPKLDPIVRTEAARLRTRLAEYYAGEGAADPVVIELPKGGYAPVIRSHGEPVTRRGALSARPWRNVAIAALVLGLVTAGATVWRWMRPAAKPTLAVLPFLNLSHDAENEYFSDGLADEITELLAQTDGLDVTARTSSFVLKGARLDAREIGARLNATVLLEGSVQRASDRVKIIVQLVRAADGKHLWSDSYEREMHDIFGTQREIAAAVSSALRLKLGSALRHSTENLEALELYFRGRYAVERRLPTVALQYFEQASARDPNNALAHAGAAQALLEMAVSVPAHAELHQRAKAAADRALQLDPSLSEAHAALGEIEIQRYAWAEAERALRRAIELNPNNAWARSELANYLLAPQGLFEEAVSQTRRALSLDPLSSRTNAFAGYTLMMAGQYREAEQVARKGVALDPSRVDDQLNLGRSLSFQQRHQEAMAALQEGDRGAPGVGLSWSLVCVAVRAGHHDEALRLLQQILSQAPQQHPRPDNRLFMVYACLRDKERALEYAEKLYDARQPYLPQFLAYPELAWLRSDPQIIALRQRIGLPPGN